MKKQGFFYNLVEYIMNIIHLNDMSGRNDVDLFMSSEDFGDSKR